jgi:hypothetical protein
MYNALHGQNSNADILLGILGMKKQEVGRFRDAWITDEGEIAIYTRLGGGNRECYCNELDEIKHNGCYQPYIEELQKHPLYIRDYDDDFDCTYATFLFKVPEEFRSLVHEAKSAQDPKFEKTPSERFLEKMEQIKQMTPDEVQATYPELSKIVEKIAENVKREEKQNEYKIS